MRSCLGDASFEIRGLLCGRSNAVIRFDWSRMTLSYEGIDHVHNGPDLPVVQRLRETVTAYVLPTAFATEMVPRCNLDQHCHCVSVHNYSNSPHVFPLQSHTEGF